MTRLSTGSIVLGVIVLAGSLSASAQAPQGQGGGAPPPPLQNLQVFPKDTGERRSTRRCKRSPPRSA